MGRMAGCEGVDFEEKGMICRRGEVSGDEGELVFSDAVVQCEE